MLTGKALFNTLLAELNEMGLPGMSATLDDMYRSPNFLELDPLMAIANLVEPEYCAATRFNQNRRHNTIREISFGEYKRFPGAELRETVIVKTPVH